MHKLKKLILIILSISIAPLYLMFSNSTEIEASSNDNNLNTFFTFIVGKTFEHLDMWVDLFFVSIWMLVDEKENINIENKKETIPSLIGIVLGLLLQYFI